ncbi:MAG: chromosomal replication initiator protein DnaA [Planctomycetota bacterium]
MKSVLLQDSWTSAREGLQVRFGAECYQRWLADITVLSDGEDEVRLGVANRFLQEWIESRYLDGIREVLEGQAGRELTLDISIDPVLFRKHREEQKRIFATPGEASGSSSRVDSGQGLEPVAWRGKDTRGRRRSSGEAHDEGFELENYVEGEPNRLACRAALEVSRAPGAFYNPLFIWGGSGVGKTHLLRGIESAAGQELKKRCVSADRFFNHYVASIQDGTTEKFRRLYRSLDLLLIDDVQNLSSKKKTQVELLHTIDHLVQAGRQVVITSTRGPRDLEELSPALRGRFLSGLVTRIRPPDYKMKRKIVRHHWARLGRGRGALSEGTRGEIDSEVLEFLAEGIRGGAHELLGAVLQLDVHARVLGRPLSIAETRRVLVERAGRGRSGPTTEKIIQETAGYFNLPVSEFSSANRLRPIVFARQVAIYLTRKFTPLSFSEIGRNFGNRNHTTVRCAVAKIAGLLEGSDPMVCNPVNAIIDRLEE